MHPGPSPLGARPGRVRSAPASPRQGSEVGLVVELTLALAVGGALGLGEGPTQGGGDLVGLDLDHRPLVALGGLPAAALEPADDHRPVALGEGVGDVLGQLPPDIDAEEAGLPVPPGVAVLDAGGHGQAEVGPRVAIGGEPEAGGAGEVAGGGGSWVGLRGMVGGGSVMAALLGLGLVGGWLRWWSGWVGLVLLPGRVG